MRDEIVKVYTRYDIISNAIIVTTFPPLSVMPEVGEEIWETELKYTDTEYQFSSQEDGLDGVKFVHYRKRRDKLCHT